MSDGSTKTIALRPRSVADFYQETMAVLESLEMPVTIWTTPIEVGDRTPFEKDQSMHPMIQNMHNGYGAF
jgi:hypothetical protein